MCDPNNMKSVAAAESKFGTTNDDFEEDLALMTADYKKPSSHSQIEVDDSDNFDSDNEKEIIDNEGSENETIDNEDAEDETLEGGSSSEEDRSGVIDEDSFDSESDVEEKASCKKSGVRGNEESTKTKCKRKMKSPDQPETRKKSKIVAEFSSDSDDGDAEKLFTSNESEEDNKNGREGSENDETWEDIYGRIRAKDGSIVVVS